MAGGSESVDLRAVSFTSVAMLAFAANSLLCRLALGRGLTDPASFATVRVAAGVVALGLIVQLRGQPRRHRGAGWRAAAMLFTYMACFSFAYLSLAAGTGALILFGAVQLTMFVFALRAGERFAALSWAGLALAALGLVYLVLPGVSAPDPLGAALMAVAGVAWGVYSLLGKAAEDPLAATARNFLYALPLVLAVSLLHWRELELSPAGLALAALSGAVTSGCGYVVWYAALPRLTAGRAAVVQLSVPVIAAFGGVALLSEAVTGRLLLASAATLGGVAIVLAQRAARPAPREAAEAG
ncbi:Threonine/homoserine efflux transporter RhtA [Tistlia consotensis]|uniref:Threonine/homoserine efflux transporter RhtA n=1 Tax=Tistlia consotensis USBA 355 TaxID=560819 RepID=A0A1Y6CZD7_9PROT|nr:DMT family transporter [Tistlia consotensis]SMF84593.1 Threonine/homoserine efflux transporter RhtA [Tistlia consotensis USBA 355]SNS37225.1 Threonine/homoserine efflux transporter RhtA [Tistlia consotensis]